MHRETYMKLITIRTQIRELPARLEAEWHRPDGSWRRILQDIPDTQKIYETISALDLERATQDDIEKAMGFAGWIYDPKCHECGLNFDAVVQLGEEPDYESHTADICIECLQTALTEVSK